MPATPMTATSDVFDGLATPGAATSTRPLGVPPLDTAALGGGQAAASHGQHESDVFEFVQTPAHGSGASQAATAVLAVATGGIAGGVVVAMAAPSSIQDERCPGAAAASGVAPAGAGVVRRPGFCLDVNGLAESSVSGVLGCMRHARVTGW